MSSFNSKIALGSPIPYGEPHALSVSLPTWESNVGWAAADVEIVKSMSTGYPRFFIHRTIQKLAKMCLQQIGIEEDLCMLFSTSRAAQECVSFIMRHSDSAGMSREKFHVMHTRLAGDGSDPMWLYVAIFPSHEWKFAKSYWQYAGAGISSRYAEACLSLLPCNHMFSEPQGNSCTMVSTEHGRIEKLTLRERIATLAAFGHTFDGVDSQSRYSIEALGNIPREDDVFLYATGMLAIWHSHQLAMAWLPDTKSACFGFPYTDTVKILQKWGPGCYFYGDDPDTNLATFETFLASSDFHFRPDDSPPVAAVFCELPSNPLLRSPDLLRLRQLANKYRFLIIIDDTVGNFVNVNVLQHADIIATSLSKLFSGAADVMGGSLVFNPQSRHYHALKTRLASSYVDDYFPADAIQMEVNSRDFASRVDVINANTRAVCHLLRSRSLSMNPRSLDCSKLVIKEVFYPEWITRDNYDISRRPGKDDNFGPLFSLTFVSLAASKAFYNALPCAKGPSLGTNFTLACPYTILAHYQELQWAGNYGIEEGLVRVSVGVEDREVLLRWFQHSVEAAEAICH